MDNHSLVVGRRRRDGRVEGRARVRRSRGVEDIRVPPEVSSNAISHKHSHPNARNKNSKLNVRRSLPSSFEGISETHNLVTVVSASLRHERAVESEGREVEPGSLECDGHAAQNVHWEALRVCSGEEGAHDAEAY